MAKWFQVGVGSGGMVVLDLLCRDPRFTGAVLVEPDTYEPHNATRHYFPPSAAGRSKLELAAEWVRAHRPDFELLTVNADLLDEASESEYLPTLAECSFGVCAVDNEMAKYRFDQLMRRFALPWTLGEVLSGGIGGWVHRFRAEGACYGCVAGVLQRGVQLDNAPPPDYSQPEAERVETRVPASIASIHAIASLHALLTAELFEEAGEPKGEAESLLLSLKQVPEIFAEAFRPHRFRTERSPACLMCGTRLPHVENLDEALAEAMARLGG